MVTVNKRRVMMPSFRRVQFAVLAAVLMAAVATVTPRQVFAGVGTSPSAPSARVDIARYGAGLTAGITEPDRSIALRTAGPAYSSPDSRLDQEMEHG